jgi:NodT family efflux transporter outer membrane factor (OMF) lipoprotein
MKQMFLAAGSMLALAGCAVGPNYAAPKPPASASDMFVAAKSQALVTNAPVAGEWWRLYEDPILDKLIADALAANTDIRVAAARVAKARASLREVGADRTPQVGFSSSTQYGRLPVNQSPIGADRENWNVSAGLNVSYEVDLFGRVSRNVEAARADVAGATADADAVRVMVVAETVRAYADVASTATRLDVATQIVALLDRSRSLTASRVEVGQSAPLDVARISALREQRQANVPALQAEHDAALFRLAMLTGRAPADLPTEAAARTTLLRIDQPIPVGDGAALLARRPDIRAAERRLASSTARIGVATADLYPRITLGGSGGSTGFGFGDFLGAGPIRWLVGPLINWSLNQSVARARIAGAQADTQAALATFDGTVLGALRETETALSAYSHAIERGQALQNARNQAARAAQIARDRQREGAIDGLELLDVERTLADTEADLASAKAAVSERQIDLFRALGGGWQDNKAG